MREDEPGPKSSIGRFSRRQNLMGSRLTLDTFTGQAL